MPTVEKSAHLGILRSKSNQKTENSQIEQNITKARRTAYSLLSTGFYEKNGLDPITSISLYKTYVQPVLMYGLEIVQPKQTNLKKLEVFQKNILKQILMLQIQQYTSYQAYYLGYRSYIRYQIYDCLTTYVDNMMTQ
jgi:hypothetical protein